MSLINVLLLLLAATTGLLARTVYFDPSQSQNCPYVPFQSCNFIDPQYWIGGVAPTNGDDVVFPNGRFWMDIYQNIELASLTIDNANSSSILILNISYPLFGNAPQVKVDSVGSYTQGRFWFNSRLVYGFMDSGEFRLDLYGSVTVDQALTVDGSLAVYGQGLGMLTVPGELMVQNLLKATQIAGRLGSIVASQIYFDGLDNFLVHDGIYVTDAATHTHMYAGNLFVPRIGKLTMYNSVVTLENDWSTEATFTFDQTYFESPTMTMKNYQPSSITASKFGTGLLTLLGTLTRFDGIAYKDVKFLGANVAQDYNDNFIVEGDMLINVNPATSSSGSLSMQFATLNANEMTYSKVVVQGTLTMKSKLTFAPSFATPVFGPFNATNILSFNSLVVDPSLKTPVDISDLYPEMSVVLMPNSWGLAVSR